MLTRFFNTIRLTIKPTITAFYPYLVLLVLSLFLYVFAAIFYLDHHLNSKGNQSLSRIEHHFSEAKKQTLHLFSYADPQYTCDNEMAKLLRKVAFFSDFIAEIGVFNQSPVLYCTSTLGNSDVSVYSDLYQQSLLPSSYEALSYTQTAITQQFALIYVYTDEHHKGISMVIPSRHIIRIINDRVKQFSVPFDVFINQEGVINEQQYYVIKTLKFPSEHFPIVLEFYITPSTYSYFLIQQSWALLCIYLMLLTSYFYYKKSAFKNAA